MYARLHAYGVGPSRRRPSTTGSRSRCRARRRRHDGPLAPRAARARPACSRSPRGRGPRWTPALVSTIAAPRHGEAVTDARLAAVQSGTPTLDLTFDATAASAIADATRTHVGEYLAIALDGVAIVVPVIQRDPRRAAAAQLRDGRH